MERSEIKLDESFFNSVTRYLEHYLNVYDNYEKYSKEIETMFSDISEYTSSEILTVFREQMDKLNKMVKDYHSMVQQAKTAYENVKKEFGKLDTDMAISLGMHRKYYDRGYDW